MADRDLSTEQPTIKIAITGGGSGGHLNAAIGVIQELEGNHLRIFSSLVYIGGTRGMIGDSAPSIESRKIPPLGVRFIGIRSGKLHRGRFGLESLKLLFGVLGGFVDSWKVLRTERPDLLFSTGGYVTVPVVIVAKLLRIRVIIHEQTIVSGLANRIAAKFADQVLVSFENSAKFFPKEKVVLTGSPLQKSRFRDDIPSGIFDEYVTYLERFVGHREHKPFIFVTGGGLGSHKINQWVLDNAEDLCKHFNILIQTGENQVHKDYEKFIALRALNEQVRESIYPVKWFGDEIGYIYSHADLVVCRPGANTVLELLATNRKALLIPIPWSSASEQQLNAEYFIENQTGRIVGQEKIDLELLPSLMEFASRDSKNSTDLIEKNAAVKIVGELLK